MEEHRAIDSSAALGLAAPKPSDHRPSTHALKWHDLVPLLIALLSCIAGTYTALRQPVDNVFAGFLLNQRGCVEYGTCRSAGPHASAGAYERVLHHGALWFRILRWDLREHVPLSVLQAITVFAFLASAWAVCFIARRHLSARGASLAVALYIPLTLFATNLPAMINASFLSLPIALYYIAAMSFIEGGGIIAAMLASVALSFATSLDLISAMLIPVHLLAVMVLARNPWRTTIAAALSAILPFALESFDALKEILAFVGWKGAIACLACAAVCSWGASRIRRRRVDQALLSRRWEIFLQGTAVYVLLVALAGNIIGQPGPHYYAPAFIPLAVLAASSVDNRLLRPASLRAVMLAILCVAGSICLVFAPHAYPLGLPISLLGLAIASMAASVHAARQLISRQKKRWIPGYCVLLLLALPIGASAPDIAGFIPCSEEQRWTLREADEMTAQLYKAGFSYPEIVASIQGPSTDSLMPLVAARDPDAVAAPSPAQARTPGWSLLVLKAGPHEAAAAKGVVSAVQLGGSSVGLIVKAPSYLDRASFRVCRAESSSSASCVANEPDGRLRHESPYLPMEGLQKALAPSSASGPASFRVSMGLRTAGRGEPHLIRALPGWPINWRIRSVTGVRFEGRLPGEEVRLLDDKAAAGRIEFEGDSSLPDGIAAGVGWTPNFIEVASENEPLLEPFRRNHPRLCSPVTYGYTSPGH